MKRTYIIPALLSVMIISMLSQCNPRIEEELYAGTETCRSCHEKFYQLWSPSHHGLAMQGIDEKFISSQLTFSDQPVEVQGSLFLAHSEGDSLLITESKLESVSNYRALHVLGGKYIYYFLTELEKGRLQVLPIAYDVQAKEWYNTPASAVRHFVDQIEDEELDWHSFAYTFNTSCHSCHVSQLSNVYNDQTNTYHTSWREPGINCETCHGPSADHVKVCTKAGPDNVPEDLKIIVTKTFTHEQHNSSCGPCHAKMRPITASFMPGEKFFDHFDLTTLEDPDFYPDGRDLGENYTYTGWRMSGCVQSGQLDCIHCHTSSGRYRFLTEKPNNACLPCHQGKVDHLWDHSHHPEGTEGIVCIACHMPKTVFARMNRSDHSMRPPMPAASREFGSPNACNLCHLDQDTLWAESWVQKWEANWDSDKVIQQGKLLLEARNGDWSHLGDIVDGLRRNQFDEIYATSFLRLLESCPDPIKWEGIIPQLGHPSPLVRSAAVFSLGQAVSPETTPALLASLQDDYRIVRRAAAASLSLFPPQAFSADQQQFISPFLIEYENSFLNRPDDWAAHYNLGNFYQNRGQYDQAINAYEKSLRLFPENVAVLINQSYTYNLLEKKEISLNRLYKALELDPGNEAANLNFAMLMGELGRLEEAERALRKVIEINPTSAQAAYNLGIIVTSKDSLEGLRWMEKAAEWSPQEPRYMYSLAFYQFKYGYREQATNLLLELIDTFPYYAESWILLGTIYDREKRVGKARELFTKGLESEHLSAEDKGRIKELLDGLN